MNTTIRIFLFISIFFSTINSSAQRDWIDFGNNGENGQYPEIEFYSNSSLTVDFFGVYRYFKEKEDTIDDALKLPGNNAITEDFGFPMLPALTSYIEVTGVEPTLTINSTDFILIENFYLWPAQNEKEMWEGAPEPTFEKNDSIYPE
jgi:hypothetical protein